MSDSIVNYYARRAPEYERVFQKPERQADLRWLRTFVEKTFAGERVFELACGTGYWTECLARSAESLLATDINEEVLDVARAKPWGSANIEFRAADAYSLPAFDDRFSAGFAGSWWSHVSKSRLGDFLQGFHRVFAQDAHIAFLDNVYVEGSSTPISRADSEGNTFQVRRLDDGSSYEVLKNFPTEAELRNAVSGMACDVEVTFVQHYWVLSYRVSPVG